MVRKDNRVFIWDIARHCSTQRAADGTGATAWVDRQLPTGPEFTRSLCKTYKLEPWACKSRGDWECSIVTQKERLVWVWLPQHWVWWLWPWSHSQSWSSLKPGAPAFGSLLAIIDSWLVGVRCWARQLWSSAVSKWISLVRLTELLFPFP